ncbi:hypothetical protein BK127_40335 [Paenibacillus sp. FSL H7-0331]|nr:hypothetical protein BK127_40335 [Paenibacillus sp. FSL H7-0331]
MHPYLACLVLFGSAGHKKVPSPAGDYIGKASGIALLVCLMGVYLSVTNWDAPSVLMETSAFRDYLISFYAEFVLAGAGAFVLIRTLRGIISSVVFFLSEAYTLGSTPANATSFLGD